MFTDKLFKLESFKKQYEAVIILSSCSSIVNLEWEVDKVTLLDSINWNNLISIASALSFSDKNEHLDAALRISQTILTEELCNRQQKDAAAIILLNLTNKPAINLAIKRNLINENFQENLPFSIKLQNNKSILENAIVLNDNIIHLNKFQNAVHNSYVNNDAISISAPTSAGKSFILCNIIIEELIDKQLNIVYIVPTRALISQVESDLRKLVTTYKLKNVSITTVPQNSSELNQSNIWVFTQERLHWFLIESQSVGIDLFVVDEAHKIEDPYRGILLQQKLEEVVKNNPTVKVLFSSPFTSNPELLLENVRSNSRQDSINTQFVAVNQNLIFATQVPRKTDQWELNLCLVNKSIKLGKLIFSDRPTSELKKMAYMSIAFSSNGTGNIIYSNGAAQAEDIALVLYDSLPIEQESNNIVELIKIVKKTVHKDYRLAKVLEKRIAFHYGNMPLLIRQEIERLFKEGEIKYLICTSTLLEGVNLPAKSIFIRKPHRGKSTPLNQNDFWNLAGRAGRWGKEFSGNIICIEPNSWEIQPNPNKSKQKIIRALDIINEHKNDLIEYIKEKSPREKANSRQDLEFAFGYYYIKYINGELLPNIEFEQELAQVFGEIKDQIQLPDYIIKRNPGISPFAQQNLFEYFSTKSNDIESIIPVYPEDDNAYEEYIKLIGRIGKTLSDYPAVLNYSRSILLINWMSGKPLSYIIRKSYESYQKKEKVNKSIHTVIREVMDNVENFARFRFAKDSSCYVDILRYFLALHKRDDLLSRIPQLNLWLEFGVSQKTHLSLLSLGLTRNTVIELSTYITNTNMSKDEAMLWLNNIDLKSLDLSPIIIEDILAKISNG